MFRLYIPTGEGHLVGVAVPDNLVAGAYTLTGKVSAKLGQASDEMTVPFIIRNYDPNNRTYLPMVQRN